MPKGYQQLTYEKRCQIHALKASGDSHRQIARQLGINSRTVDREIRRNSGQRGYCYKQAEAKARQWRHRKTGRPLKMTPALIALIEEKLIQYQWSPE